MKISNDELKCISLFESLTGAPVDDCVIEPDHLIFLVKEGEMGRAIGKAGANILRVRDAFGGKRVDVLENAETPEAFVRKLYAGIEIRELKIVGNEDKQIEITVPAKDRGAAIGRNGDRIKLGRMILERRFGVKLKLV